MFFYSSSLFLGVLASCQSLLICYEGPLLYHIVHCGDTGLALLSWQWRWLLRLYSSVFSSFWQPWQLEMLSAGQCLSTFSKIICWSVYFFNINQLDTGKCNCTFSRVALTIMPLWAFRYTKYKIIVQKSLGLGICLRHEGHLFWVLEGCVGSRTRQRRKRLCLLDDRTGNGSYEEMK